MRQGIREDRERVLGVTQKKARTERNSSDTFANNAINTTNNEYNCVSMKGFCVWKQKKYHSVNLAVKGCILNMKEHSVYRKVLPFRCFSY